MLDTKERKTNKIFEKVAYQHMYGKQPPEDLSSTNSPYSTVLCEDQHFGIVRVEKSMPAFCEWVITPIYLTMENIAGDKEKLLEERKKNISNINQYSEKNKLKTIVIVLESPHKDEFIHNNSGWKSIGPACGTTGKNIKELLPVVLLNYFPSSTDSNSKAKYCSCRDIESGEYVVMLVNAIQYQCSLGEDTTQYRDVVFSEMWNDDKVKRSFGNRLEESHPDIIINCCTKGAYKEEMETLRWKVQQEINKIPNCLLLRAAHPSSVHFRNGLSYIVNDSQTKLKTTGNDSNNID